MKIWTNPEVQSVYTALLDIRDNARSDAEKDTLHDLCVWDKGYVAGVDLCLKVIRSAFTREVKAK